MAEEAEAASDNLTIVLFYDENANQFLNEPPNGGICGGSIGLPPDTASSGSHIDLKTIVSQESNLSSVSAEDVKYKLQVDMENKSLTNDVNVASSGLLVTTSGEVVEVDNYNKFKEMVMARCQKNLFVQPLQREQQQQEQQEQQEQRKSMLGNIQEFNLKVFEREAAILAQKQEAAAAEHRGMMKEFMKRRVRKEWKMVSKRILVSRIEKYFK